jgi:uncharacterized damage-inducible protein DinB
MDSLELIKKLYEYDSWANLETLVGLATLTSGREKPLKYFSHVIAAQRIWRSRFDDPAPFTGEAWPVTSIEDCRRAIDELHARWADLLGRMTEEKLAEDLVYKNLKGMDLRTSIGDVLMHVITHSVHHRGQAAAAIRDSGGMPSATDFTVYVRKLKG